MEQKISIPARSSNKSFEWSSFISFNSFITLRFMQIVYIGGAAILTLACLSGLFANSYTVMFIPGGKIAIFLALIFGNILWRIQCELIIVLFRINGTLNNIENNTKKEQLFSAT